MDTTYLLNRAYDHINQARQDTLEKTKIPQPITVCSNRKTFFQNFRDICNRLNRSESDLQTFLMKETSEKITIDINSVLIIHGHMFKSSEMKNLIVKYVKENVQCQECKSLDTHLLKQNRINFIVCKNCHSNKSK